MSHVNFPIAQTSSEWAFGAGVVLVLLGLFLRVRLSHCAMQSEELVKEGLLTDDQARRRVAVVSLAGPAAIIAGLVVCVWVVWS